MTFINSQRENKYITAFKTEAYLRCSVQVFSIFQHFYFIQRFAKLFEVSNLLL